MKKCKNCCSDLDDKASKCEVCGVNQNRSIEPHQIITVLILASCFTLIGVLARTGIEYMGSNKPEVSGITTTNLSKSSYRVNTVLCDMRSKTESVEKGQKITITGSVSSLDTDVISVSGCEITIE